MLSEIEQKLIAAAVAQGVVPEAACIDALNIVQQQRGWISDEAVADIARAIGLSSAEVDSVASFYSLIFRRQVGRYVILICDSVSCWMVGYQTIRQKLETTLGITLGQTTKNGLFTVLPVACLGICDQGPAMMVGEKLYSRLNPERLEVILREYGWEG